MTDSTNANVSKLALYGRSWLDLTRFRISGRLAKGTLWSLIGSAVPLLVSLIVSILIARLIGAKGLGELSIIMATLGMFGAFAGSSLGLTAAKHVAEFREKDAARAGRILGLSSVVGTVTSGIASVFLVCLAPYLTDRILNAPHLVFEFQMACILLFLNVLKGIQVGALSGFEAFKEIAIASFWSSLGTLPLIIGGVYFWGLAGAVGGYVLAAALGWLINYIALRDQIRKSGISVVFWGFKKEFPILWKFSLPAVLSSCTFASTVWVASAMLVRQPDGFIQMGLFSAANQWRTGLMFIPGVLAQVLVPMLSNYLGKDARESARKTVMLSILVNAAAVMIPALGLGFFGSSIMDLYGESFREGSSVLIVCLLIACLIAIEKPAGNLVAAAGKMWLAFGMNLGWALTLLMCMWFLASWGAIGLAYSYAIAYIVHGFWTLGFVFFYFRQK